MSQIYFAKKLKQQEKILAEAKVVEAKDHRIKHKDFPPHIVGMIKKLNTNGFSAYLVGGAIRDLLLGFKPKDFDLVTNATPNQIKSIFKRNCLIIGRRFKLAHVYYGSGYRNNFIEVATFRKNVVISSTNKNEINKNYIKRDNEYGDVKQDMHRRDFSINGLFYDYHTQKVYDFVDGYEDIKNKKLSILGDPELRYQEDPVRMLRALRFCTKLSVTMDAKTKNPIKNLGNLLNTVSGTRLFDETIKIFHTGCGAAAFKLLKEFNLLGYLFPDVDKLIKTAGEQDKTNQFILDVLTNTDSRIKNNLGFHPIFLIAVFLWYPLKNKINSFDKDKVDIDLVKDLSYKVIMKQNSRIPIPKRFYKMILEIWILQYNFEALDSQSTNINYLMKHKRFKMAYDFLLIRSSTEPELKQVLEKIPLS